MSNSCENQPPLLIWRSRSSCPKLEMGAGARSGGSPLRRACHLSQLQDKACQQPQQILTRVTAPEAPASSLHVYSAEGYRSLILQQRALGGLRLYMVSKCLGGSELPRVTLGLEDSPPELEASLVIKFPHPLDAQFPSVKDVGCNRTTQMQAVHTGPRHAGLAEPNL